MSSTNTFIVSPETTILINCHLTDSLSSLNKAIVTFINLTEDKRGYSLGMDYVIAHTML